MADPSRPTFAELVSALEVYAASGSWQEPASDHGGITFVGPGVDGGHPADRAREALGGGGRIDSRTQGILDGVYMYAWMKDGTYYVGTAGTTLRYARRRILDEQGYTGVPDPFYS